MAIVYTMIHRTHNRHPVHPGRHSGNFVPKPDPGKGSGDGFEVPTDFGGGFWLGVPHVEVAGPTIKENKDTRVGGGGDGR